MPDLAVIFFIIGAIFGSFANVIIVRMPKEESLWPSSHCCSCNKKIPWRYNIPIFAWLFLKGACVFCKGKISPRYFWVELIMATLFAITFIKHGWSWFTLEVLIFVFGAVTASFIDIDHMILPDEFTLGGTAIALLGAACSPERSFVDALIGCIVGGGTLLGIGYLYWLLRRRDGMGGGDIKLFAWVGALTGLVALPFILMMSCLLGTIYALIYMKLLNKNAEEGFPFGPAIVMATLIYLLVGPGTIVQWFLPGLATS